VQLENSHEFNSVFTLDSAVGWSSLDYDRRNFAPSLHDQHASLAPAGTGRSRQRAQRCAELRRRPVLCAAAGPLQPLEKTKAVFGAEYRLSRFGPGWGDNPKDFRMGETGSAGTPNIISGLDSHVLNPSGVTVCGA